MRSLIKVGILIPSLFVCLGLKAQTFKAKYTYDANGNRETVSVVYLSQSSSSSSSGEDNNSKVEEELKVDDVTNLIINIFPNPTKGELRVELTGADEKMLKSSSNSIKVWDLQGRLLFSNKLVGPSNVVDLSRYSNGTYILQLFINEKVKDFKIVKN